MGGNLIEWCVSFISYSVWVYLPTYRSIWILGLDFGEFRSSKGGNTEWRIYEIKLSAAKLDIFEICSGFLLILKAVGPEAILFYYSSKF